MNHRVDLGDLCVFCRRSTAFGGGLFVNRIPADTYDEDDDTYYDGYACAECTTPDEDELCRFWCKQPGCMCGNFGMDGPCTDCVAGQHVL